MRVTQGLGEKIAHYLHNNNSRQGLNYILCVSTRATSWLGFAISSRSDLRSVRISRHAKEVQYPAGTPKDDIFPRVNITYNMIYLLTAIGLSPGGSSTVHIYTQTIHRTTQQQNNTNNN